MVYLNVITVHRGGIYQFFVHFFCISMYKQMEPIFILKKFNNNLNVNMTFAVIGDFMS